MKSNHPILNKEHAKAALEGFHEGLIPSKVGYEPSWPLIIVQAVLGSLLNTTILIISIITILLTAASWFALPNSYSGHF